ncbi:hypothetical protein D3C80_1929600 [compost metagenome]
MAEQHDVFAQSLGTGGADVVLTQHVQHGSAGHASDERDVDGRQSQGRQNGTIKKRTDTPCDTAKTLNRKPFQVDGEELDEDVTDDEDRHRKADD